MKLRIRLFWFFIFCLWQCTDCTAQRLHLQTDLINEEDGMENSFVNDVIQDSRGLMWIATERGLHCYDGFVFTIYNRDIESPVQLTSHRISSVVEDENGNILVGSDNGLNVIDPVKRTLKLYLNRRNNDYPSQGKFKGFCTVEKSQDGTIWINDGGKICQLVNDKIIYADIEQDENPIHFHRSDNKGNLVIIKFGRHLTIIDNKGKLLNEINNSETQGIFDAESYVFAFVEDDGSMVIKADDNQFYKFNDNYTSLDSFDFVPESITGMLNAFISEFSPIGFRDGLTKENVLIRITRVYRDESGLLWLGTNFGLVKIGYQKNEFKTPGVVGEASLREMYEADDGKIYTGAYPPFSFYSYHPVTEKVKQYGVSNVWCIEPIGKDTLLLGRAGSGVVLFSTKEEKILFESSSESAFQNFHCFEKARNGKIWLGASLNLYTANTSDLNEVLPYRTPEGEEFFERLIINQIVTDIENDTRIWVATSNGLYLLDEKKGIIKSYLSDEDSEWSILDNNVQYIIQDKGRNLWLGTSGGLNYINSTNGILKSYTTDDGLADNLIYTMVMDDDGYLWLGTHNGLSRFNPKTESFANFYESDGLAYREFNRGSVLKTRSGELYFGGLSGFTRFVPQEILIEKIDFKPFISKYALYDKKIKRQVEVIPGRNKSTKIRLDPRNRNIEFSLGMTDYSNPRQAKFQVQLEGFDPGWVNLGNKNTVRYTNLDEGAYTFNARVANKEGLWSNEPVTAEIIVKEPFWGSDLFFGTIFLSMIGVVVAFYFSRLSYELASFQLRNRIANDLHDEVSNTLNNIRIISAEARMGGNNSKELKRIAQMSSRAIEHVQDVIWAIDQEKENIKFLQFRMEDYVDILLRENQIPVNFKTQNLNLDNPLSFLFRRNLLLIFKEAISNMVKHTNCKQVKVKMGNKNGKFVLECTNYFDSKKKPNYKSGRGLSSMKQRAEAIGGTLNVDETDGKFTIRLELKEEL